MKNLSLKLDDEIFLETEKVVEKLGTTRNRYINEALAIYNKYYNRKMLRNQLVKESRAAYGSSRDILDEYERLIDED
jgi:metal-responsive CopG/Arc/MetJ family transcriptional regulator